MKMITKESLATDVISHEVTPQTVHTDAGGYTRFGWLVVLLGLGGFLLWALFAPLDKGVPMSGTVSKEGSRKSVQYLTGGIVEDILVKDGDRVKAGQVLVRMNSVQAKSQLEISRSQYFSGRLAEARLLAERDGASALVFPAELEAFKNDPRVVTNLALQRQLLASRRSALQNELSAIEENIAGVKSQISGTKESMASKREQMNYLKEQLDNMRDLAKDGYVARSRLLDLERTYAQLNGSLAEDIGTLGRYQRTVMETTLRRSQRIEEYQREVRSQLSDGQRELSSLASRITAQEFDLANAEVKAPVDGVVVGSSVFTRGGVVTPGFKMMDLVPLDDALVVEGQLPVNLVDKVHSGLPVELIFSAFNANTTPHLPGKVITVAADRTVDEHTGNAYYKVRAALTPEGARIVAEKKLEIQSGMPVELFVKTGERTMMSYLMKPILDRSHSALRED